jgi:acyl-CoA hydrolase
VHVDQIDVIVESERDPFLLADAEPSAADLAIAEFVRPEIPDGATLQTGIGGIPSTVMRLLAAGDGGDYGIHSEMFTTGLMHLHRAGKVSNRHKGQFDGVSVTTFAAGTAELYAWLDDNHDVAFLPVDVVNAPDVIARNRSMITLNGALSVDLHGQVVADTIDGRQYSGIGGHEDFIAPSGLSLDDRSLVCLRSTSVVGGAPISRIVPALPEGSIVTTPRHQLDLVVTEHGVARLRGRTVRERAQALAGVAAPEFRDALLERAATL